MINEERLINNFIELVGVPCPSGDEKAEAAMLVKRLTDLGVEVKVDNAGSKCNGTTGNVWGFLPGNVPGATRVFFEAHMDSVAPTTGTKVIRREGVLYSDGTTTLGGDDKVGIAAALEMLQQVIDNRLPHGDIQVCFAIGEEVGSWGMRYLDPSWIKADVGYCLDCGDKPGCIFNASPKALHLTYTVTGKAAHAGLEPEKGINAIMLAAKALGSLPWYGRLNATTTLSIGTIQGGLAANIVAETCSFVIDMRCPDEAVLEDLKNSTTKIITEAVAEGGGTTAVEEELVSPAVFVPEDAPAVALAAKAGRAIGLPVKLGSTGGCSDANFLCGYGLSTILLSTGMDKIHTCQEQLAEEDLCNTARWALAIVKEAAAQAK